MNIYRVELAKKGLDKNNHEWKSVYARADGFDTAVQCIRIAYPDWSVESISVPENTEFLNF